MQNLNIWKNCKNYGLTHLLEIIVWFMDPINHLSKSQEYGWDYLGKLFGEQLV